MKNIIKNYLLKSRIFKLPVMIFKNFKMKKILKKDYDYFLKNYSFSKQTMNKLDYQLMLEIHCIEKGMSSLNPRIFGLSHVKKIISILNIFSRYNYTSFTSDLGYSILDKYLEFYRQHNWEDSENYVVASDFLHGKEYQVIECGIMNVKKDDIIKKASIDYLGFLKSRKSVRVFDKRKLQQKDIDKVIEMVKYTPTACNRQMCKIYQIKNSNNINLIEKKINGLTCFEKDTLTYFLITYDQNAFFSIKERNQGYFNAGLYTTNFVNAMHSLGIGSCILQCDNLPDDMHEIKKMMNIPDNEVIASYIAAGYYINEFNVPVSPRKKKEDIYKEL